VGLSMPDRGVIGGFHCAYWLAVRVALRAPLTVVDAREHGVPTSAVGFYQNFGITHRSEEEVRRIAGEQIAPIIGIIDWSDSRIALIGPATLNPRVLARSKDWTEIGVWYKSGDVSLRAKKNSRASRL
jgi:hypothetical protein